MCTMIGATLKVAGAAKGPSGWAGVDQVDVGYDHATRLWSEHALRIDLRSSSSPEAEHVALELDLASGKALLASLTAIIAKADEAER